MLCSGDLLAATSLLRRPIEWSRNIAIKYIFGQTRQIVIDFQQPCSAEALKSSVIASQMLRVITMSNINVSISIIITETWHQQAVELMQELGRRMTAVNEDARDRGN